MNDDSRIESDMSRPGPFKQPAMVGKETWMGKKPATGNVSWIPCDIMVPNKGKTDISIWGCIAGVSTFPPSNAHTYVTS